MTENEIRKELVDNNVEDNPFDVMLYHSIEITRDLLFAIHRLKVNSIPKSIITNPERLQKRMDMLLKEFNSLLNMSPDTVDLCRETSYYYQRDSFDEMNNILLKFERNMETEYCKCYPNRNDRFERIRLGEDSQEYKRLLRLRDIIDNSEELSNAEKDYLHSLCDIIDRPKECIEYGWVTENEFKERSGIIEKYELSVDDVKYMISYKFKE